jgi:hypothetical protein
MSFFRKIINSDFLAPIINLPPELKDKKVEIIILPVEEDRKERNAKKSLRGALNKYSDPELLEKEEIAWKMAVTDKYEDS